MRRREYLLAVAGVAGSSGCAGWRRHTPTGVRTSSEQSTVAPGAVHVTPNPIEAVGQWPRFQYDHANTGHDPMGSVSADLEPAWLRRFDSDVEFARYGRPVSVVDETLFVFGTVTDPREQVTLFALDVTDGELRWHETLPEFDYVPRGYPAVDADRVYLWQDELLTALDRTDGTEVWTSEEPIALSPVTHGGFVYTGRQQEVFALRADDGRVAWRTSADLPKWGITPAVDDAGVYLGTNSGIRALEPDTGEERWSVSRDHSAVRPMVADDAVVATGETTLTAVDRETGAERWHREGPLPKTREGLPQNRYRVNPATDGRRVICYTEQNIVLAFDLASGDRLWETDIRPTGFSTPGDPPQIIGDSVYVREVGRYHSIDPGTGEWKRFLQHPADGAPAFGVDDDPPLRLLWMCDGIVVIGSDRYIGVYGCV